MMKAVHVVNFLPEHMTTHGDSAIKGSCPIAERHNLRIHRG